MRILPKLFNMNWNDGKLLGDDEKSVNQIYLEKVGCAELYERMMKANLWDIPFEKFLYECNNYK